VSKEEFVQWYTRSETRMKDEMKKLFARLDKNKSNTIDKEEVRSMLTGLGGHPTDKEVEEAIASIKTNPEDPGQVTFEMFEAWYTNSLFWTQQKDAAAQAAESIKSMWEGTLEGFGELKDPSVRHSPLHKNARVRAWGQ